MYRVLSPLHMGTYPDHQSGELIELPADVADRLVESGVVESLAAVDDGATAGDSLPPASLSSASLEEARIETPLSDGIDAALPKGSPPKNDTVSLLVNLNTATLAELTALPRIGESTANKLIAARPLGSAEDARIAAGLSELRWADVAPLVTL